MAAWQLCLISAAAMVDAIWEARVHLVAAEMEIGFARVPHRPATDAIIQIEQAGLAGDFCAGPCGDQSARWCRRDRCLLIAGALAQKSAGSDRNDARLRCDRGVCRRVRCGRGGRGDWRGGAGRNWRCDGRGGRSDARGNRAWFGGCCHAGCRFGRCLGALCLGLVVRFYR